MLIVRLKLLLLLLCGHSLAHPVTLTAREDTYRLNGDFIPTAYTIDLTVTDDFATSEVFDGVVNIKIDKPKNDKSKIIQLHMDAEIEKSVNISLNNVKIEEDNLKYNTNTEIMTITLDSVPTAAFELKFVYRGKLYTDSLYGFYLSKPSVDK